MRRLVLLLVAVTLLASACSIRTAGAPKGDLTLVATFDDTQQLVTGHSVQMADVKVGTVTSVKLVAGYKSQVTMSIKDGYRIPEGTSAEIKVTSLLGENFVQLTLPPGRTMASGPFLADGARITRTSTQPSFEQVVGKAGPLIQALAGDDLAAVINAGATAFGGQGGKLNSTVAKTGELIELFADQREQLGTAVDQFARLGRSLAAGKDNLAQAPAELERVTRVLNDNSDEIIDTVGELTRTARLLGDKVLQGRVQKLNRLIRQLDPVLKSLVADRQRIGALLDGLVEFTSELPRATYDGQLLIYPIVRLVLPDGTVLLPPGSGGGNTAGFAKVKRGSDPLPGGIRKAMPNLDDIVGRP